jgi:hypothetical protein
MINSLQPEVLGGTITLFVLISIVHATLIGTTLTRLVSVEVTVVVPPLESSPTAVAVTILVELIQ